MVREPHVHSGGMHPEGCRLGSAVRRNPKYVMGKWQGVAYLWLNDLQIPHLDARRSEVGNLKLDLDGSLSLARTRDSPHAAAEAAHHASSFVVVATDARQPELRAHQELLAAAELLDLPDDGGGFGRVVHGADVCAEAGRVGVVGDGDDDGDVVGGAAAFELGFCLRKMCVSLIPNLTRQPTLKYWIPSTCIRSYCLSDSRQHTPPKSTASLAYSTDSSSAQTRHPAV